MPAAVPTITTSRLILRPLDLADADAVQAVFPQWEIVQFLTKKIPWPYPDDGALTFIRDIALPAMLQGEGWHWSIRPQLVPEQLIGVIGLMDKPDENRGFWLDPVWQGRGLMSEASTAVTDYWFETLERPVLRVPKGDREPALPPHLRAQRHAGDQDRGLGLCIRPLCYRSLGNHPRRMAQAPPLGRQRLCRRGFA
jgi:[ribosomal protein S5]-alanine N-acetyltransferase